MDSQGVAASSDPQVEYERRLATAEESIRRLNDSDGRLSTLRGVSFVAGLVLLWLGARETVSPWWLLGPTVVFAGGVIRHGRVRRELVLAKRRAEYYQTCVARLNDAWTGTGASGSRYRSAEHVYVDDLDIFGEGSLFQLICRARTRLGEDQLAEWFGEGATKPVVLARQQAVVELRDEIDLREELALLDADVHDDFDQNQLRSWALEPAQPISKSALALAVVLSIGAVAGLTSWLLFTGPAPLIIVLLVQLPFLFSFRHRIMGVVQGMDDAGRGLAILIQVLALMERRTFRNPCLQEIAARLDVDGLPPSKTIARLAARIQYLNNSVRNQFFIPFAVLLCLPLHLVNAIEAWRATVGRHIPQWLSAVGDFEALVSLAGYAYERPTDPFPAISEERVELDARQIGHPLLPAAACVRNDVRLNAESRLLLVSGSNMSGKSTLLRTVGTNVTLALAGAPVRAESLTVSCFQVGTAMRISDSLQEGKSLFFAVLGRLKRVVDLTSEDRPLLFLLDEILQGTNSHDRRIGAEAVIRSLLSRDAVGFVTTHDLALTEIATDLAGATNVHFADQLNDGRMTFDYQLRPGVVAKSNALELMRLVGLDV